MSKSIRKLFTLAIAVALCMSLSIPSLAANSRGVTFLASLNHSTLNVSSEAQTVVMSIDSNIGMTLDGLGYTIVYSSPLTLTAIACTDPQITYTAADYYFVTGKVGWSTPDAENISGVTNIGSITFTVPANTPAGTYNVGVQGIELSQDYGGIVWEPNGSASATLTIVDPNAAPASTGAALDKAAASVSDGKTVTLTPSLLPAGTDETITSTSWSSNDTDVATVANGIVTGVSAGTATITATVNTSGGKVYYPTCEVTVTEPAASPYTVSIERSGTGKVYAGSNVTMLVKVSGADYDGAQVTVTYNPTLFTYVSCDTASVDVATGSGTVKLTAASATGFAGGSIMATLAFQAKEVSATTAGNFGFDAATAATFIEAAAGDAVPAQTSGCSVTITKQYTVTFWDKDGGTVGSPVTVDQGDKVVSVPNAPDVNYHTFAKWNDGANDYTAAEIKDLTVTGDVTYTATYTANSYTVTLPAGVTGAASATYGSDYTGTITSFDNTNYDYTVQYTAGGTQNTAVVNTTNGTFTIPGANITGNLTVTVAKAIKGITVSVYADYVTGYSLVLVKGANATGYSYGGHDMFRVAAYDNAYAWLVAGSITGAAAGAQVQVGSAPAAIPVGYNVNGTGSVDFNDYLAAFGCYHIVGIYPVESNMKLYLAADVNGDKIVDSADIIAISGNYT